MRIALQLTRVRITISAFYLLAALLLNVPATVVATEPQKADEVIIDKSDRKLYLLADQKILRTFDIALGLRPEGDKKHEGDLRTPEGKYLLDTRNPNSDFFLSIHISYPNAEDRSEAAVLGESPGGAIMIHGQPNEPSRSEMYYKTQDWTNGCIAISNSDMIDLWLMTDDNTPIEIRP